MRFINFIDTLFELTDVYFSNNQNFKRERELYVFIIFLPKSNHKTVIEVVTFFLTQVQSALVKIPAFMVSKGFGDAILETNRARERRQDNSKLSFIGRFTFEDFYGKYDAA